MGQKILHFHLQAGQRRLAENPSHIIGQIVKTLRNAGWEIQIERPHEALDLSGYHLVHNQPISRANFLNLRPCYIPHHYRIEDTNDRWEWQIAHEVFTPSGGKEWFLRYWQQRLFKGHDIFSGGYIFMPLQGKLLERRHFQSASPVDMIKATLASDPARKIIATLHPKENYSTEERAALANMGDRFTLSDRASIELLAGCDYVVTENSALALIGYFARKNAVLFARIDFHHIATTMTNTTAKTFVQVLQPQPFGSYLHWFFKENALSDRSDTIEAQITHRLRHFGWPI
jgi:hypothetical protein